MSDGERRDPLHLVVGHLSKAHGTKGELVVLPLTDHPEGTYASGVVLSLGGVDTDGISSATMESRTVPGLHFIGEVVDVTGWLGGYNFQWAWASGHAAGMAVGG